MFTSKAKLEQKTGKWGMGRFKYLQSLVTEFQDTSRHEYKLQVLANLANFAYDPVNYDFFRQLNILDLFLDVIAEDKDEQMVEFAMGGICNCCLDRQNMAYLLENDCIQFTVKCLSSSNEETVLSAITTLIYISTPDSKKAITADSIVDLMKRFSVSSSKRLSNLATVFLEDVCCLMVEPPPKKMRVETSDDEVDTEKGKEEEGKAKVVEEEGNVEGEKEGEKESEKKEVEGDGSKHAAEESGEKREQKKE